MGGHRLAPILLVQIFIVNIISACLPREYMINNICCPMCDKGSFVKAHCTKESSSSVCVICADTTYMDHPNGLTACFRCKECDSGANLVVKEKCTVSSNTICECSAGHYCANLDCDICQEHKSCPPGQYVRKPGTQRADTVCNPCPQGHFSAKNNSAECSPWTKCLGRILAEEGTSTTDSKCEEKRTHYGSIAAILLVTIITPFAVIYFRKCKPKKEVTETNIETEINIKTEDIAIPMSKEESKNPVVESQLIVKNPNDNGR